MPGCQVDAKAPPEFLGFSSRAKLRMRRDSRVVSWSVEMLLVVELQVGSPGKQKNGLQELSMIVVSMLK
jgi:hypothetical protein